MPRTVWIFARPLSHSRWLPPLAKTSDGTYQLCHWAVLVSDKSIDELKSLTLQSSIESTSTAAEEILGRLYELDRDGSRSTSRLWTQFSLAQLRESWVQFSSQFVGETRMTDPQINAQGIRTIIFELTI